MTFSQLCEVSVQHRAVIPERSYRQLSEKKKNFASQIEEKIDEESYNYRLNRVLTPKMSLEEALYVY